MPVTASSFRKIEEGFESSAVLPDKILKVSSANMADIKINELSNRLKNIEKIIDLVFKLPDSYFYRTLLEKKILQFEEMIVQYPESANDIAEDQRAKVVSMWFRYCTKFDSSSKETSSENSDDEKVKANCSSESSGAEENNSKNDSKELIVFSEKNDTKSETNEIHQSKSVVNTVAASSLDESHPKKRFDLEKCELRHSLEQSFAKLNAVESGADVDGIKKLLQEAARAKTELARYPDDTRLHFIIFQAAFAKLSLELREQFFSIYGTQDGSINIPNLIALLEAEIVAQHTKKVTLTNSILNLKQNKTWESNFPPSASVPFRRSFLPIFCKYCKSRDHVRDQCPNIKELLCFRCYQNGHTKRDCTYESG